MLRGSALLFLLLYAGAAVACRNYSPVERHFLRIPAVNAAELSGIAREKWLKRARKLPGVAQQARENHYLALPASARPRGLLAPEGEVQFFPSEAGGRDGIVALHWQEPAGRPGTERLWLLKTEGARYLAQSLKRWLPDEPGNYRYSLRAVAGAIVCYPRAGRGQSQANPRAITLRRHRGQWLVE